VAYKGLETWRCVRPGTPCVRNAGGSPADQRLRSNLCTPSPVAMAGTDSINRSMGRACSATTGLDAGAERETRGRSSGRSVPRTRRPSTRTLEGGEQHLPARAGFVAVGEQTAPTPVQDLVAGGMEPPLGRWGAGQDGTSEGFPLAGKAPRQAMATATWAAPELWPDASTL